MAVHVHLEIKNTKTVVSTKGCEFVYELIELLQTRFPESLGKIDCSHITIHETVEGDPVDVEARFGELKSGQEKGTPLIIKTIKAATSSATVSDLSPSSSKESINSTASVERKRRIADLVEFTNTHKKQKEDGNLAFTYFGTNHKSIFPIFLGPCGADVLVPPTHDLPEALIDSIHDDLKMKINVLGKMTDGPERKRERFIDAFILPIAATLGGITIEIEMTLVGIDVPANGDIEYVVKVGDKLIIILEAKKDDFDKGRGQNFVECEVAYELNNERQSFVYGIVTNSVMWFFNKVYGDSVKEATLTIGFETGTVYPTRESVKSIASVIAGIMNEMKSK